MNKIEIIQTDSVRGPQVAVLVKLDRLPTSTDDAISEAIRVLKVNQIQKRGK